MVLRAHLEHTIVLAAILWNETYRRDYFKWVPYDEGSKKLWAKVKPSQAFKAISCAVDSPEWMSATAPLVAHLSNYYADMSPAVHGNAVTLILSNHIADESGQPTRSALGGGRVGGRSHKLLRDAAGINRLLIQLVLWELLRGTATDESNKATGAQAMLQIVMAAWPFLNALTEDIDKRGDRQAAAGISPEEQAVE